ncbi:hypothetical protein RJT34_11067 [Clitoria ternatea]|uniref:NB-ARC domain-containing protein n=1 Tax=Clitoria ternatea TaxID=43366 RepID=A0AAN9PK61_CLITE
MKAFLRYAADANKQKKDPRRNNTYLGKLCSTFRKLKAKHRIGSQLQSIKGKVAETTERPKKSMVDESQLVGIESTKRELEAWLNDDNVNFKLLSIVGMGGLGKTALAKKILGDASHFKRRALAIVSQTLKEDEFFMDLIQQLFPGEVWEMQQLPIHRQKERLRKRLEDDSYLIVVDDVWEIKHWDQIKVTFPKNNHGSRVVVTTRKEPVARHSTKEYNGHVHQLEPLSESDSWDLFCKKTFLTRCVPSNLEPICRDIIHAKCRGVPVAILAISGLLATLDEHNIKAWRKVGDIRPKYTLVTELPEEISMLQKLHHLLISTLSAPQGYDLDKPLGVKVTSNIRCLDSLQHLCLIEVPEDKDWLKGLKSLTQLRKLGLFNLKEQHWEQVCGSISKMTNLLSLKLQTFGSFKLDYMRNPPPLLQQLQLDGQMDELPSWVCCSSLPHLQLLKLFNTKLRKDPGASIASFPSLAGLILGNAFSEDVKIRVEFPGFPRLYMLMIDGLSISFPWELIDEGYTLGYEQFPDSQCMIGWSIQFSGGLLHPLHHHGTLQ